MTTNKPIFISGIGTGIGKTVIAAIVTEALNGIYWKPVQAGTSDETDSAWVQKMISHPEQIADETYRLKMPASPHIAARKQKIEISLDTILTNYKMIAEKYQHPVIIEGAGGLLAPLNSVAFSIDLAKKLKATMILVSCNYLGSINHSLMSARMCSYEKIKVAGWIFNKHYLHYENEIAQWSGLNIIGKIPDCKKVTSRFIREQAGKLKSKLIAHL
ncbi:MAG: dethiobiotin synthase [Bacteroidetes bacterium]|nr:dethiobiotin synthase [Bacteroidota bacterium]